jgi:hypothetical protein
MQGLASGTGRDQTIDALDATSTTINGVNDDGRIVGFSVDANPRERSLVLVWDFRLR